MGSIISILETEIKFKTYLYITTAVLSCPITEKIFCNIISPYKKIF